MGFFRDLMVQASADVGGRETPSEAGDASGAPSGTLGDDLVSRLTDRQLRKDEKLKVTLEIFRSGIAPDREHEIRIARTRWLEEHRAVASFTCGIAAEDDAAVQDPDPWGERHVRTVPVTVAVTAEEFVFLREGSDEPGTEPIVEVGRFARAAFASAHLEDARGNRVAAPAGDVFEPAAPCTLVVAWRRDDGTEDHDTFAFMSLSVAEEAAGRFRRFAAAT